MTDLTPEKLAGLRAVAEAAFPVEDWAIWSDLKEGGFVQVGNAQGVIPEGQFVTAEDAEPNPVAKAYTPELGAHIAAFDPPTVLSLISALEAKTAEAQRIPLYAMLDVFHAVTGTSHPGWDRFYEKHGYAESWARVLAMVRDAVRERDEARAEVDDLAADSGHKAAKKVQSIIRDVIEEHSHDRESGIDYGCSCGEPGGDTNGYARQADHLTDQIMQALQEGP